MDCFLCYHHSFINCVRKMCCCSCLLHIFVGIWTSYGDIHEILDGSKCILGSYLFQWCLPFRKSLKLKFLSIMRRPKEFQSFPRPMLVRTFPFSPKQRLTYFFCSFRIIRIFIRMVLQCHLIKQKQFFD